GFSPRAFFDGLHQFGNEFSRQLLGNPEGSKSHRSSLENGFSLVQRRQIRSLKELSNRNFITPKQRFLHCTLPIRWVVGRIVLELLDAFPEPGISVVVVVRHTWAEYINECESFVPESLLHQFNQVLRLAAETAGNERRARGQSQGDGVNGLLDVAERHAF